MSDHKDRYKYPKLDKKPVALSAHIRPFCVKTGKATWANKKEAKEQAEEYRNRFGSKMNAYDCSCGGWHIGHKLYYKKSKEN